MRLLGFKYLRRRYVVILAGTIVLISTLFSVTSYSLLGFYNGFVNSIEGEKGIVTVYDERSTTPFTGYVQLDLTDQINMIPGVIASSPEVLVPGTIRDEPIFVRGVIPQEFSKLNSLTFIDGNMLSMNDAESIILGESLANRLGLKLNEEVLLYGVLTKCYLELHVKGIYVSHSTLDDEALVPLYVGQWLRRIQMSQVTLIRVKIEGNVATSTKILEGITVETSEPGQDGEKPNNQSGDVPPSARPDIDKIGVEEGLMRTYFDRYGITRETLLVLSVLVFIFSSASIVIASTTLVRQHRREIEVLRSLGASNKTVRTDLLVKALSLSFVSVLMGTSLSLLMLWIAGKGGYLQILSHSIDLAFNPLILLLNLGLVFTLVAMSTARSPFRKAN